MNRKTPYFARTAFALFLSLIPFLMLESALAQDRERIDAIPLGDEWKYSDSGVRPEGWNLVDFDDSAWSGGNAPLGHGEPDIVTQVARGNITTYFRKTLSFGPTDPIERYWDNFRGSIRRDDGAVIYLNGVEVFRTNMPAGTIENETLASSAVAGAGEDEFHDFTIPLELFKPGKNVLAVEVHQNTPGSSDLMLDLLLTADRWANETVANYHEGSDGIVYFIAGNAGVERWRVLRYDLSAKEWLEPIVLDEAFGTEPRGLGTDDDWLYIASEETGVRRIPLAGGDAEQVIDEPIARTTRVLFHGDFLILAGGSGLWSYNLATSGVPVHTQGGVTIHPELAIDNRGRIITAFGSNFRSRLASSAYQIEPDGQFTFLFSESVDIDVGVPPGGAWISPDGQTAYAAGGQAFKWGDTPGGKAIGLGQPLISMTFVDAGSGRFIPITLRSGQVSATGANGLNFGDSYQLEPGLDAMKLSFDGDALVAFSQNLDGWGDSSVDLELIPLDAVTLPPAPAIADYEGAKLNVFPPVLGQDGMVNFYAEEAGGILQWSPATRLFENLLPISTAIDGLFPSPDGRLYLSRGDGQLDYLDETGVQQVFAPLPAESDSISSLSVEGDYVLVSLRGPESRAGFAAFDLDGNLTGTLSDRISEIKASGVPRRFFAATTGDPIEIELGLDGSLARIGSAPRDTVFTNDPLGDYAIGSNGAIVHAPTGLQLQLLPHTPSHPHLGSWGFDSDGFMVSRILNRFTPQPELFGEAETIIVQSTARFPLTTRGRQRLNGSNLGLLALPGESEWLVSTQQDGHLRLYVLDDSAEKLFASAAPPALPSQLAVASRSQTTGTFTWRDESDNETGFVLERLSETETRWEFVHEFPADTEIGTAEGLEPGVSFWCRLRAKNALGFSPPTESFQFVTYPEGDQVGVLEGGLMFNQRYPTSQRISWTTATLTPGTEVTIERAPNNEPSEAEITFLELTEGATSYVDVGLSPGREYYYRYFLTNGEMTARSHWHRSSTPPLPGSPPAEDIRFGAYFVDTNRVIFELNSPLVDADEYTVSRSENGGDYVELARLRWNQLFYFDDDVVPGVVYNYQIIASNPFGEAEPEEMRRTIELPGNGEDYSGHSTVDPEGVVHFAFRVPARIERFDTAAGEWLDPWAFFLPPSQLVAHGGSIYTLFAAELVRLGADGERGETIWDGGGTAPLEMIAFGDWLAIRTLDGIQIIDPADGQVLSTLGDRWQSMVPDAPRRRLFVAGNSTADFHAARFGEDGTLTSIARAVPNEYDFISSTKIVPLPDPSSFALDSGPRLTGDDVLTFDSGFAGGLSQAIAWGADWLVSSGDELRLVDPVHLRESRIRILPDTPARIAAGGEIAYAFTPSRGARGMEVEALTAEDFAPRETVPLDLAGLEFRCDQVLSDTTGNVYCLDVENSAVFRWSASERRALAPIELYEAPGFIFVSDDGSSMTVQYDNGRLTQIDLADPAQPQRELFTGLAGGRGFIPINDGHMIVMANRDPIVLSPEGRVIPNVFSDRITLTNSRWEADTQTLIILSSRDLIKFRFGDGGQLIETIEERLESVSGSISSHLAFSPDGQKVVGFDGQVINYVDDTTVSTSSFGDYLWLDDDRILNGIRGEELFSLIEIRSAPSFVVTESRNYPVSLFDTILAGEHLVAVFFDPDESSPPSFSIIDTSTLAPLHDSIARPAAPENLSVVTRRLDSIDIAWTMTAPIDQIVELREAGTVRWHEVARGSELESFSVTGLEAATLYDFRVSAANADLVSNGVTVQASTLTGNEPAGAPYALRIDRMFATNLLLAWDDNAENESGFNVYQEAGPNADFLSATLIETLPANSTTLALDVTPSTLYTFWVQAFNDDGEAELSQPLTLQTLATDDAPPVGEPVNLELVSEGAGEVTLRWLDVTANESGFHIYRSTTFGALGTRIGSVDFNVTEFTDSGVDGAVQYYYQIAAFNPQGELVQSAPALGVLTTAGGGTYSGLYFRAANILYFAVDAPDRIERFNLATGDWLTPLQLPGPATSLFVDGTDAFVSTPSHLVAFLDGAPQTREFRGAGAPDQVFAHFGTVFGRTGDRTYQTYPLTLHLEFGSVTSPVPLDYFLREAGGDSENLLALSQAGGSSVLASVSGFPGSFEVTTGPAIAESGDAAELFRFPDGKRLVTSGGTILSVSGLTGVERWPDAPGRFDDLTFRGDVPIARHGTELIAYTNLLGSAASHTLDSTPAKMIADVNDLLLFYPETDNTHGLRIERLSFDDFRVPQPDAERLITEAVIENPLIVQTAEGNVHLVSPHLATQFTYQKDSSQWLPGMVLPDVPSAFGTYPDARRVVLGFPDGRIDPFFSPQGGVVGAVSGFASIGNLLAVASSGPAPKITVLGHPLGNAESIDAEAAFGSLISDGERIYFREAGRVVSWKIDDGKFLDRRQSAILAGAPADLDPAIGLLLTSGAILDPETLAPGAIGDDPESLDAAIASGVANLLKASDSGSRIEKRNPDGSLVALIGLPGEPLWIGGGAATTVVTLIDGQPTVFCITADNSVDVPGSSPPIALSPRSTRSTTRPSSSISQTCSPWATLGTCSTTENSTSPRAII